MMTKGTVSMNTIATRAAIGALACVALAGISVGPAFADAPTPTPTPTKHARTLADIQSLAATKTTDRISKLTAAISKVNSDSSLSSSARSSILGTLNGDLSGMKTVEAKVAADTSLGQATADYKTIFTDYRVYSVAIPQARIVAAADHATSVDIPRLTKAQARLSTVLAGKDKSKSTPALQADLSDATNEITKASSTFGNLASSALAVTPAAYNSNRGVLKSLKSSLTTARAALKQARTDLKDVATAVKTK
jgi:hypothetical protein